MRRAILVASSEFQDSELHPLRFPVRDAERFRDILADPDFCGFDEVTLLANEDTATAKRTLERCARISEPGDLILFYYNGHGKLDRDGSLALAMPATDSEILRSTSLPADEIKGLFNLSRASQRVMILDCCYSGAADSHGFKSSVADSINALAQQFAGSFLLTASRRFERAWELDKEQAGALTEALVDGVRTGAAAPGESDHITLGQLAAYARRSVPASSPQQPEYWDDGIGEVIFSKKARLFDTAWAAKARRMITHYVSRHVLDEELAEELREVIGSPNRTRHAARLRLIDRLTAKEIQVSAFVGAWSRAKEAEAPPPQSPPPREADQIAPPKAPSVPLTEADDGGSRPPGEPVPPVTPPQAYARSHRERLILSAGLIVFLLLAIFSLWNGRPTYTDSNFTADNTTNMAFGPYMLPDLNAAAIPSDNNVESNTVGM